MMKKKILTTLLFLTTAAGAWAEEGVWVEMKDATKQGFLFADNPIITYTADNLVMTTTKVTAEFPFADISKLYFDGNITVSAVENASGENTQIIRTTNGVVELSGFKGGTEVAVYDIMGKLIQLYETDADGNLSVDLATMSQGIYIIKAQQSTIKILNK